MVPTVGTNVDRREVFVKVHVVPMDIVVGRAFLTVQVEPKKLVSVGDTIVSKNKQVMFFKSLTVTVTDTNINKDTAYSQLLSKTFEIFFT